MASFTNIVTIDRPIDEVFAFLANLENVPKWNYAVTETRKSSPGPVGVGTTYVQKRHLPRPSEERLTVTDLEPDRCVAVEGTLGPFPARVRYDLEPSGDRTRVTNSVELEVTGALRLIGPIAASRVKTAVAENLGVLKRVLEAG
ncbi:MAG TPA: SRPBCC family protein [Actinomycetota bacterium]|nr:SRPBCC family protein [Actinomycetota bacterium]